MGNPDRAAHAILNWHIMETNVFELKELDAIIALRRDLHAHPETAYSETRTAALVAEHLICSGIEVHTGIAQTGVVGVLRRGTSARSLMLRAD
ncbi:hypothetical protein KDH83_31940, partial [Achromobacter sp. Marseille-Q0513]|nr:hypothetical protein [Achromobacter sp. Marseille-Q0513]